MKIKLNLLVFSLQLFSIFASAQNLSLIPKSLNDNKVVPVHSSVFTENFEGTFLPYGWS